MLQPQKISTKSIASISNLAAALELPEKAILDALKIPTEDRYKSFKIPKADGDMRTVHDPCPAFRLLQRKINNRILKPLIKWPEYLYGSVPNINDTYFEPSRWSGRDYVSCAAKHCGAKSILKVDIKDFFDNIQEHLVLEIWMEFFHYPYQVSKTLTEICCHEGRLAQGSLCSSYLACLCLWDVEKDAVKKLQRRNLVYTRLIDDITVSSRISNYDFDYAFEHIRRMLIEKDLPINKEKTRTINGSMEPLSVHGLRVDGKTPRLPSQEPKKIRAAVKNIEILASKSNYRTSRTYRKSYYQCMGRVNKLNRVGHSSYNKLLERLKKITPLPSRQDIHIAYNRTRSLEKRNSRGQDHRYRRSYYITLHLVHIINKSFPSEGEKIKRRLLKVKPK